MMSSSTTSRQGPVDLVFQGTLFEFGQSMGSTQFAPPLSRVVIQSPGGALFPLKNSSFSVRSLPPDADLDSLVRVFALAPERLVINHAGVRADLLVQLSWIPASVPPNVDEPIRGAIAAAIGSVSPDAPEEFYETVVREALGRMRVDGYFVQIDSIRTSPRNTGARLTRTNDSAPAVYSGVVYVSGTPEQGRAVRDALLDLLDDYQAEVLHQDNEGFGSWWQRFTFRLSGLAGSDAGQAALEKVKLRLEIELLNRAQAEVDNLKADSASKLIAATSEIDSVVIVFGQVLFIKHEGVASLRAVDAQTAAKIESSPVLLSRPDKVLALLQEPVGKSRDSTVEGLDPRET